MTVKLDALDFQNNGLPARIGSQQMYMGKYPVLRLVQRHN